MKMAYLKSHSRATSAAFLRIVPAFGTLPLLTGLPHAAMAQATTLGEIMCNASHNATPFAWLMNGIAYIAGAIFIGNGLVHLIHHQHDARQHKLSTAIWMIVAGAGLLFLPSFITVSINSLFGVASGGGITACVPEVTVSGGGGGG